MVGDCFLEFRIRCPVADAVSACRRAGVHAGSHSVKTDGAVINVLKGGEGPPLLLIHGHPETHVTWHKIAAELAREYTVVLPDLRGYGHSSKPDGRERQVNYSFRAMAQDQVETMRHFGYERFFVAGHDRGARAAHRLCLDHPDTVLKVCVMDIVPTLTMYRDTNKEFATRYVWWFLQIQPFPMPEHIIGLDPEYYLREHLGVQGKTPGAVTPEAMAEYLRCYCCSGTIHAACEDYRAAADIDLEMDEADDKSGRKMTAPVLALWGARELLEKCGMSWKRGARKLHRLPGKPWTVGTFSRKSSQKRSLPSFASFSEGKISAMRPVFRWEMWQFTGVRPICGHPLCVPSNRSTRTARWTDSTTRTTQRSASRSKRT